jgi:hypothetical protein
LHRLEARIALGGVEGSLDGAVVERERRLRLADATSQLAQAQDLGWILAAERDEDALAPLLFAPGREVGQLALQVDKKLLDRKSVV